MRPCREMGTRWVRRNAGCRWPTSPSWPGSRARPSRASSTTARASIRPRARASRRRWRRSATARTAPRGRCAPVARQTIGLVVSTLATVGNSRMLQAVADAAAARGYALTVVTACRGRHRRRLRAPARPGCGRRDRAQRGHRRRARSRRPGRPRARRRGLPGRRPVTPSCRPITRPAAAAATAHLLRSGTRPSGISPGPAGSFAAAERERGLARGAARRPAPTCPTSLRGDWTAASGHSRRPPRSPQRPEVTALFAANDQMALGALRALAEAGRAVPDDVSVVGLRRRGGCRGLPPAAHHRAPGVR